MTPPRAFHVNCETRNRQLRFADFVGAKKGNFNRISVSSSADDFDSDWIRQKCLCPRRKSLGGLRSRTLKSKSCRSRSLHHKGLQELAVERLKTLRCVRILALKNSIRTNKVKNLTKPHREVKRQQ